MINVMQRLLAKHEARNKAMGLLGMKVRRDTDGSTAQIANLLGCKMAKDVDQDVLQTLKDRWNIYADIWQNEEEHNIEHVLKSAGGDPKIAQLIVELRKVYRGKVTLRPPVIFNVDGTKTFPEPIIKNV